MIYSVIAMVSMAAAEKYNTHKIIYGVGIHRKTLQGFWVGHYSGKEWGRLGDWAQYLDGGIKMAVNGQV